MPDQYPSISTLRNALLAIIPLTVPDREALADALTAELVAKNWARLAGQAPKLGLGIAIAPGLLGGGTTSDQIDVPLTGTATSGMRLCAAPTLLGEVSAELTYATATNAGVRFTKSGLAPLLAGTAWAVLGSIRETAE